MGLRRIDIHGGYKGGWVGGGGVCWTENQGGDDEGLDGGGGWTQNQGVDDGGLGGGGGWTENVGGDE